MDRGFVFLLLVHHARKVKDVEPTKWLSEVVHQSGLPSLSDIRAESTVECAELKAAAQVDQNAERLKHFWDQGDAVRETHGYQESFGGVGVPLPPIYCNDLEWVLPDHPSQRMTADQIEERWESSNRLAAQFEEFRDACGI